MSGREERRETGCNCLFRVDDPHTFTYIHTHTCESSFPLQPNGPRRLAIQGTFNPTAKMKQCTAMTNNDSHTILLQVQEGDQPALPMSLVQHSPSDMLPC